MSEQSSADDRVVVLIDGPVPKEQLERIRRLSPRIELVEGVSPEGLHKAHVVYTARGRFDPAEAPHLRWVQIMTVALNPILGQPIARSDVPIANARGVYALAVAPGQRGQGLGARFVTECLEEARRLRIRRVMALTYEQAFFSRCGFTVVDRQHLPLKVWSQCLQCPKNQACDEIAMMYELEDVPDVDVPRAEIPAADAYVVPVVQRIGRNGEQQRPE